MYYYRTDVYPRFGQHGLCYAVYGNVGTIGTLVHGTCTLSCDIDIRVCERACITHYCKLLHFAVRRNARTAQTYRSQPHDIEHQTR